MREAKRAAGTGREDIEAVVAASGLTVGQRIELHGEITFLSADSEGDVWMRVRLDDGRSHFDCWATQHKSVANSREDSERNEG